HYVLLGPNGLDEYIVSADPLADVWVRSYDYSTSPDRATWKLRGRAVCMVPGGYTDVLERYMKGASTDEVAAELALEPADARQRIARALSRLRQRIADY